jgi:hypothetical protein
MQAWREAMSIQMPYSPLDALVDCLPEVRKAGRVKPGDNVITVHQRIADVFLPIVKRIQSEAIEQCAQTVDNYRDKTCADNYEGQQAKSACNFVAMRIRALKG